MSIAFISPNSIHTTLCSITRWPDAVFRNRPGTYMVIANLEVLRFIRMDKSLDAVWSHPSAVMDDFGDLVGVPQ